MLVAVSTVLSSLISGLVAIYVCTVQNNKNIVLIQYRLEELEKEVKAHNNFDKRLSIVEDRLMRHEV